MIFFLALEFWDDLPPPPKKKLAVFTITTVFFPSAGGVWVPSTVFLTITRHWQRQRRWIATWSSRDVGFERCSAGLSEWYRDLYVQQQPLPWGQKIQKKQNPCRVLLKLYNHNLDFLQSGQRCLLNANWLILWSNSLTRAEMTWNSCFNKSMSYVTLRSQPFNGVCFNMF